MNETKSIVEKSIKSQLPLEPSQEISNPGDLLHRGESLMQAKTNYVTSVSVVRPRNLQMVEKKCLEEAAIAGDEFFYSWNQGGKVVQGLSVGAALAIARNYGNCAVDSQLSETFNSYVFTATFIDLETGFNLSRAFRQNKVSPKNKKGETIYSGERGEDIIFQIGQSKAIRNAILNAMPVWLINKILKKAKENVRGQIISMGIENARLKLAQKADALKVPLERIENLYGKQKSWDIEKLVSISSSLRSLENGQESVDDLFPVKQEGRFYQPPAELIDPSTGEIFEIDQSPSEKKPKTKGYN